MTEKMNQREALRAAVAEATEDELELIIVSMGNTKRVPELQTARALRANHTLLTRMDKFTGDKSPGLDELDICVRTLEQIEARYAKPQG